MSKIVKLCENCKKEFSIWSSAADRRKTCSRECGYELLRVDHRKLKPCLGCGKNTTNRKYCSNICQHNLKHKSCGDRNKALFLKGELTSRSNIKPFLIERDGRVCSSCKLEEWMSKPITLWVDHIDGNATNNCPTNLRLICPNCDSQSDTFMAKNKGNGRKSRGLKSWQ